MTRQQALSGVAEYLERVAADNGGPGYVALVDCDRLLELASALRDWPPEGAVFCRDCGAYVGIGPVQTTDGPVRLDDQCPNCRWVETRRKAAAR